VSRCGWRGGLAVLDMCVLLYNSDHTSATCVSTHDLGASAVFGFQMYRNSVADMPPVTSLVGLACYLYAEAASPCFGLTIALLLRGSVFLLPCLALLFRARRSCLRCCLLRR
jgi:hypothetical protein